MNGPTNRKERLEYTRAHRKAFRMVERELLGYNTIRGLFHDMDKQILFHFFPVDKVKKWHKAHARHHIPSAKTESDFIQMVIDWECCQYTHSGETYTAREYMEKFEPGMRSKLEPIMDRLGL